MTQRTFNKSMKKKRFSEFILKDISGWGLLLPSVLLFIMLVWRPILIGISYSFFDMKGFEPTQFVGFDNYRDVLSDTNFLRTLKNTWVYVGYSFLIGFPLPFIAAVLLNELVHGQKYFKLTTYMPVLIPGIAVSMIWKMMFMNGEGGLLNMLICKFGMNPIDWLGTKELTIPLIVISMSWQAFGSTMIIYLASLQSVNQELYEAARLDGAGLFGRIRYVLIPHMKSLLLLSVIRQLIAVFNVTQQPLVMTGGGPNGASLSLGLTNYNYAFQYGQFSRAMALGVITFLILLVFTLLYHYLDKRLED